MTASIGVPGVSAGHSTNTEAHTGCTVVLVPEGAVASVDVRGGGPGTRETDILSPHSSVGKVQAVLLAGGSAFGLAAADGVVAYLEERGYGHVTPYACVPLVPAAVIYDLGVGQPHVRPRAEDGYRAAAAARDEIEEGSVGVGTGATIGKILGEDGWMKGGFGVSSVTLAGGVTVTALTVVNAFGDVLAEDGSILAGARAPDPGLEAGEGERVVGRPLVLGHRALPALSGRPPPLQQPHRAHHSLGGGHRRAIGRHAVLAGGAPRSQRLGPRGIAGAHSGGRRRGVRLVRRETPVERVPDRGGGGCCRRRLHPAGRHRGARPARRAGAG